MVRNYTSAAAQHIIVYNKSEAREVRTPNLLIWSQTRYCCAIAPGAHEPAMETRKTKMFTIPLPVMAWTKMTVKGTLSE